MEPDEIRAEIEQRRQRARDLKIRETLWHLYDRHLSRYPELMEKDQPLVSPDLKASFSLSILPRTQLFSKGVLIQFTLGTTAYQILYRERPVHVRDSWGRGFSESRVTPASIVLSLDGADVFDFDIRRSVRDGECSPVFYDDMGEITRFIEGPWVAELTDLLKTIWEHEKGVQDQRNAPALDEMKKRFGL